MVPVKIVSNHRQRISVARLFQSVRIQVTRLNIRIVLINTDHRLVHIGHVFDGELACNKMCLLGG